MIKSCVLPVRTAFVFDNNYNNTLLYSNFQTYIMQLKVVLHKGKDIINIYKYNYNKSIIMQLIHLNKIFKKNLHSGHYAILSFLM